MIHAGTEGNLKQMQISRFTAELPGAFSLSGGGEFWNLTDSVKRNGNMDFEMHTQNLNFLTGLADIAPDGSVIVPDSMHLAARVGMEGAQCTAALKLQEKEGALNLDAAYNLATEAYHADLAINNLQVHHFLPKDSIYTLTVKMSAKGQGVDVASRKTVAALNASLENYSMAIGTFPVWMCMPDSSHPLLLSVLPAIMFFSRCREMQICVLTAAIWMALWI